MGKCESLRKKERKGFYSRSKKIQPKQNSIPTNSTPPLSRKSLLNNTTQILVANQTLDDDQIMLISSINIIKTNVK